MKVPFLDLKAQHAPLLGEIEAVVKKAVMNAAFIGGAEVSSFEQEFADFCEAKYSVGVGSGTDALRFALLAAGIKDGDEVITVPNTFIATTEAITQAGGKIVFVDIDSITYNIDVTKIEEKITPRTKAIVPVHLYGQCADMDPIMRLAKKHGLVVVEDACQAHGATYKGRKAGSLGDIAAFSFYPGKNLGACGEGGAITTSNPELADRVKMLRDHGQSEKYYHEVEGYNGRLDAIQAGILRIKLRHLAKWVELRRERAAQYDELLSHLTGVVAPVMLEVNKSAYHLYVIKVGQRDMVQQRLGDLGIATGLHYPIPLHLQNAYKSMGFSAGDFPVSESVAAHLLSLPIFPELTEQQLSLVVEGLEQTVNGLGIDKANCV